MLLKDGPLKVRRSTKTIEPILLSQIRFGRLVNSVHRAVLTAWIGRVVPWFSIAVTGARSCRQVVVCWLIILITVHAITVVTVKRRIRVIPGAKISPWRAERCWRVRLSVALPVPISVALRSTRAIAVLALSLVVVVITAIPVTCIIMMSAKAHSVIARER